MMHGMLKALSVALFALLDPPPIAGVDGMLSGKAAGVQVTQNAGNPGNGISVRVRGSASLTAGNQPLYVVDGVPIQTDDFSQVGFGGQDLTAVTSINPDEIESITVLKDAASAGIYGSRASNGVVLITTKRGISGSNQISFSGYTGWQKIDRKLRMLTGPEYVAFMAEAAANDGEDPADFGFVVGVDDSVSTDWQDAVFRTAPVRDMNLGLSGGSGRVKYYVTGGYFGQTGIALGSAYNRAKRPGEYRHQRDRPPFIQQLNRAYPGKSTTAPWATTPSVEPFPNSIADQPNVPHSECGWHFYDVSQRLQYTNPVAIATYDYNPTTTQRVIASTEGKYNLTNWVQFTGRLGGDQLVLHERLWGSPLVVDENGGVGGRCDLGL